MFWIKSTLLQKYCHLRQMSQSKLHISGWIGWDWKSPSGVKYRSTDAFITGFYFFMKVNLL